MMPHESVYYAPSVDLTSECGLLKVPYEVKVVWPFTTSAPNDEELFQRRSDIVNYLNDDQNAEAFKWLDMSDVALALARKFDLIQVTVRRADAAVELHYSRG